MTNDKNDAALAPKPKVFFFGCWLVPGHHLYKHGGERFPPTCDATPWGLEIDTGLLKSLPDNPDGRTETHHKGGWTAVAFWDRTGDERPLSNSAFLVHAVLTTEEVLNLARAEWPAIFRRPNFPIK